MKKVLPFIALAFVFISAANAFVFPENKRCTSETFDGEKRATAKTSVGTGKVEGPFTYASYFTLLGGLPQESEMEDDNGKYKLNQNSKRVKPEQRNVKVTCWLYTYARESDEDFHLIFGDALGTADPTYLSAEISGLPKKKTAKSYKKLKKARADFLKIIGKDDYCQGYAGELYDAPIKVEITGSLFFETEHGCNASGPEDYKASSCWEIHPITSIKKVQ